MLLGISFRKACVIVGHKDLTNLDELTHVLNSKYVIADKLKRGNKPDSKYALMAVGWYPEGEREEIGHWVVWYDGKIFDPALGIDPPYDLVLGKVTSYLPLERR